MNIGLRLVKIAAVYMLAGLIMGLAIGISGNLTLMSVHSHILLLGWATMAVAGIVYMLMPGCSRSPLAKWHFWGHNLGLPVMMGSLALKDHGLSAAEKTLGASSTLVLVSLALFAINVVRNGRPDQASDRLSA